MCANGIYEENFYIFLFIGDKLINRDLNVN